MSSSKPIVKQNLDFIRHGIGAEMDKGEEYGEIAGYQIDAKDIHDFMLQAEGHIGKGELIGFSGCVSNNSVSGLVVWTKEG